MKTLIAVLLSIISVQLYAPPSQPFPTKEQSYQFTILTNPQFRIYYPLIKAIVYVESRGNDSAYNEKEGAKGQYQIREIRINHFNQLTGKGYSHDEMYDFYKATEVFLYYCKGRNFDIVAKSWNGSGPMTEDYWKLVNQHLISQL